jgi:hypothetical protein
VTPTTVEPLAALIVVVIVVGIAWGLTWALVSASNKPGPVLMIVSVSILTLLSLIGLAVSSGETANTFGTLAATGLGALAGSVTAIWQKKAEVTDTKEGGPE